MPRAERIKHFEEFRLTIRSAGGEATAQVDSPTGYDEAPFVLARDEAFERLLESAWRSATDAEQLGTRLCEALLPPAVQGRFWASLSDVRARGWPRAMSPLRPTGAGPVALGAALRARRAGLPGYPR